MHRNTLRYQLNEYFRIWIDSDISYPSLCPKKSSEIFTDVMQFIDTDSRCFDNDNPVGSITGSALVVSWNMTKVLLTLHTKLNRWLQLGGHSDGSGDTHLVAMREAKEESGLSKVRFAEYERALGYDRDHIPFDIDIHTIPKIGKTPEHLHFDVRYLLFASPDDTLAITSESRDLAWHTIKKARNIGDKFVFRCTLNTYFFHKGNTK